ncbi:uncharacterized protein LOC119469710 [Cebus imitator]|uniref:uncharacterized protein LOC119469710 n=1 Tax=Cebus imitator TaxID=2715852 RepID=UPI0018998803|nr:uncharacterized protein LOC119469710 [Cebus imitator]
MTDATTELTGPRRCCSRQEDSGPFLNHTQGHFPLAGSGPQPVIVARGCSQQGAPSPPLRRFSYSDRCQREADCKRQCWEPPPPLFMGRDNKEKAHVRCGGSRRGLETQSDAGELVDLHLPRTCSASNRIVGAQDHTSIQMNVAGVHKVTARFNGQFKTYALCGAIGRMGESDDSILRLSKADGIVSKNF